MSDAEVSLNYDRQDLRQATRFIEADYSGINPRQFYRHLKRQLEEVREDGSFKYQTVGDQDGDFVIRSESVGEKTGTVEGRLAAASESRHVGVVTTEYKPYGPHGAVAVVVGVLFLLLGLGGSAVLGVLGVAGLLGGGYLYLQTEPLPIPSPGRTSSGR